MNSEANSLLSTAELLQKAIRLHREGKLKDAARLLQETLAIDGRNPSALALLGTIFLQCGIKEEGVRILGLSLAIAPRQIDVLNNRGNSLRELKRHEEALSSYDQAIGINPGIAAIHINRGIVLRDLKRQLDAIASYDRAIALDPNCAEAFSNKGNALLDLLRHEEALKEYERAIAVRPNYAEAHCHRGLTLAALGRHSDALACYEHAIRINPNYFEAHNNCGNALRTLRRNEDALLSYRQAVAASPHDARAHINCGVTLRELKRVEEALDRFDQAIAKDPENSESHRFRGITLRDMDRTEEALACFETAIRLRPDYVEALVDRGNVLARLQRPAEALASYDRVIRLKPDLAEAFNNRGSLLTRLKRHREALSSLSRAIELKPDLAEAYVNRGALLAQLREFNQASDDYDNALELDPKLPNVPGDRLFCRMRGCIWQDYSATLEQLQAAIDAGDPTVGPFVATAFSSSASQLQRCAQAHAAAAFPAVRSPVWPNPPYAHDRIRIGYFSADFHDHATAHLIAGMIEKHDRSRFEIVGFSFGPATNDAWQQRLTGAFDRFIDVRSNTDREIAHLAREREIDIAVDLKGFTEDARSGIFAHRPAPIQVNYLGFPGTMGADFIDYIIADATVIPEEDFPHYTEKVVHLPHSYQINDTTKTIDETPFSRAELGLPDDGIVFCCFNSSFKITPEIFDVWMRLVRKVDGSVFWLLEDNATAVRNLTAEAEKRGVSRDRLVFGSRMPLAKHLARHRLADLFLDTFHYNAHTTASDALWAGLPILTCMGSTFAGRVAASLLRALDLPELITNSREEYETLALQLALDPDRLNEFRQKLKLNRLTKPLFDTSLFARQIEAAYATMWQRQQQGLAPDHISVRN